MPLQNRVTPTGEIVATEARGTLMGNRGIIHNPSTRTLLTRRWQHHAWVCCVLEFKGFRHPIMGVSAYTELFFLDEASALAAGHRPCAYCRRVDFNRFKRAWLSGNGFSSDGFVSIKAVDQQLHRHRVERTRRQVRYSASLATLPDGVMIRDAKQIYLVWGEQLLPWRASGYAAPMARHTGLISVLTPSSTVAALNAGYQPSVHASASSPADAAELSHGISGD